MTPYKKLTQFGQNKSTTGIAKRLFEAPDHLLIVEIFGLREDYSRIQFKDIRYVTVFTKPKAILRYIFGLIITALLGLLFFLGGGAPGLLIMVVPLIFLTISWVRQNCVCAIGTDIQQIIIPIPNTVSKVVPFVEYLRQRGAQVKPLV